MECQADMSFAVTQRAANVALPSSKVLSSDFPLADLAQDLVVDDGIREFSILRTTPPGRSR